MGRTLDTPFPHALFLVLAARLETWGELFTSGQMDWRDCNFILRNALQNGFPAVTHAADYQGKMVAILNLEALPESGPKALVQAAQGVLEVLEGEFGITVTIAISRVYESILDLPRAMADAERIYEYLALLGEDRPITAYEELTHSHLAPSETSYLELEGRLLGCIRASDFSGARQVLHELIQGEFGAAKPTVDTVRFRVYGVVNTLLYLMGDIRGVVGNDLVNAIDPGPRLTSAESLEEIVAVMDDIFNQLDQHMGKRKQSAGTVWVQEILVYVQQNFRDPNLSVSAVADHFGLSATYCSRVFKEQYGARLFDYIQRRRLEEATALLPTGKPLRQIAEQTGFSTALTLSRAFKRYEGTTRHTGRFGPGKTVPGRADSG